MKSIYIYAARLRSYWVLLPMTIILSLSIIFNNQATVLMKLYPLIIFTSACIVFTFIYLFRAIEISYSEIKYIGRFSSRDSATVIKGRTLVLDILKKGRVGIKLYGNEGYNPDIKWLQPDEGEDTDICIFRGKSFSGMRAVYKILRYFGVGEDDLKDIITNDSFSKQYTNVTVTSGTEDDHRQIKIRMDKTV